MQKICFVTTISLTLKTFVLETAKYLHGTGNYDITFICNGDEQFEKDLPPYIRLIPVDMKRGISLGGLGAMLKMRKIFRREKFDLVQYSTPNASCYAAIAARLARVPVRLYCQWGIAYVGFSGMKRRVFKAVEKMVCRFSTRVEPDSYGNLKFSVSEGLYKPEKGRVILHGSACGVPLVKFDITKKQTYRMDIRERYGIPGAGFVFGFVGRITRDKGINELFTAARDLMAEQENVYLMMVGGTEQDASVDGELFRWAKENDRVIFCGHTSMVEQYVSAMDCFVLPSYREGFGMSVVEAEVMGLPVIVTNIPGPTDAMLPDETGLVVEKKDPADLGRAMRQLMESPELCRRFGEAGRVFASDKFEQQKLFRAIDEDRRELLGQNNTIPNEGT